MREVFEEWELLFSFNKLDEKTKSIIENNKYCIFEKYKNEFIKYNNLGVKISCHAKDIMDKIYELESTKKYKKKEIFTIIANDKKLSFKAIEKTYYKYREEYFNKFQNSQESLPKP